jgi:hypothetical protein
MHLTKKEVRLADEVEYLSQKKQTLFNWVYALQLQTGKA